MIRIVSLCWLATTLAGCGDNLGQPPPPLGYTDPTGGALRLIKNPATGPTSVLLDLVVGDHALTGYAAGFDLPFDATRVSLAGFTPGTALAPGADPVAARGVVATEGPLAGMLVTAQSQKAAGTGAVATDTALAPGTVLYSIQLDLIDGAAAGVVFDGTAADFRLPSGGMRDRAGLTVVEATGVAIGTLEVNAPP